MQRKILIMGLPGAGKTTLADALAPLLNAVVFNADAVRANISRDLGFSHSDRVEHARRMVGEGADILDIGAESTRPYGDAVMVSVYSTALPPWSRVPHGEVVFA